MASQRSIEVLTLSKIFCLTGSGTHTRWGLPCIRPSGKISSRKSILRSISRTTSNSLLRVPKTTSTPKLSNRLELFEKRHKPKVFNEATPERNETSENSWARLSSKRKNTNHPYGMENLVSTWVKPEALTVFPYSQHHNRNSSTTPKENKILDQSTKVVIKNAIEKLKYSDNVNWTSLLNKVEKAPSKDGIVNMDVIKPKASRQLLSLSPSSGRGVFVTEKTDLIKAFRQVETSCNRNRVRRDSNGQRFHERPGLKRKRLKSQRWRQRFLDGFKATLDRVQELRSQGW